MSHALKSAFLVLAMSVTGGSVMAADDPAMTCDMLAASPEDLDLPDGVAGVAFDALDPTEEAEAACVAAADMVANNRRFVASLGRLYAKRGDSAGALEAYRLAHGRGSAIAANNLGAMYIRGEGVPANQRRATQLIRKAAHRGLRHAMGTMAMRAREGIGMRQSNQLSFFWYERAHEAGDTVATNDLGVMYQRGLGVREDDKKALALFSDALSNDPQNGMAALNIARAYEDGEGVDADLGWARGYFAMAFDAGEADAADDLGRFHAEGLGTVADPVAAVDWYQLGADAGSLYATVSLANAHVDGKGVERDTAKARTLYSKALDLDPDEGWRTYIYERLAELSVIEALDTPKTTE